MSRGIAENKGARWMIGPTILTLILIVIFRNYLTIGGTGFSLITFPLVIVIIGIWAFSHFHLIHRDEHSIIKSINSLSIILLLFSPLMIIFILFIGLEYLLIVFILYFGIIALMGIMSILLSIKLLDENYSLSSFIITTIALFISFPSLLWYLLY